MRWALVYGPIGERKGDYGHRNMLYGNYVSLKPEAHCGCSQVEMKRDLHFPSRPCGELIFLEGEHGMNLPYCIALYVFRFNFHFSKVIASHYL